MGKRIAVGDKITVSVTVEVLGVKRLDYGIVSVTGDYCLDFVNGDGAKEQEVFKIVDIPVITDKKYWEER